VSTSGTAHSLAGVDPFPIHARGTEEEGQSCDVCHFPDAFEIVDFADDQTTLSSVSLSVMVK
ncbi:MAG: hypothetical protein AABY74_00965, partial [Planctomycetota bacterium]